MQMHTPHGASHRPWLHLMDAPLRPLFFGAALAALEGMAMWLAELNGMATPRGHLGPFWHLHEMMFGYVAAAMGGFLLTAVPGWTDTAPLSGRPVALLAGLWLLGRVAVWLPGLPSGVVAACDLAFLTALTVALAIPVGRTGGLRSNVVVPVLAIMAVANLLWHLQTAGFATAPAGIALALGMTVFAMTYIGGRIIPHFTHRVTMREIPERPWLDAACNGSVLVWAVLHTALPGGTWSATAALLAALANGMRLAGWLHPRALTCALTWVLHAASVWLVTGLLLTAGADFGLLPPGAGIHGLTVGAIGLMTLGVMSRAALGHTGRVVTAPAGMGVAFALVFTAALVRVGLPLAAGHLYGVALNLSGLLWMAGFGIYLWVYTPILLGPEPRAAEESALPRAGGRGQV
ncbi:MAG: NnrS family protein [Nitrospirota bacterium]|nr:NnrS family protein [Nitrospirota bacterium]